MAISPEDFALMQKMLQEGKQIDPVIYGLLTSCSLIIGYFCKRIIDKTDFLSENSATKEELKIQCDLKQKNMDALVTKEHCILTTQINTDRLNTVHLRLDAQHLENKEGHLAIKEDLKAINSSIKQLVECVTKLSMSGTCE
ncbi:hypothetical protein [Sulfurovum sp.]|uniref:hypothetical protein n=1 Tax=Sulfurovum sp. TaxID=1969726 RepID=UPI0035620476